MVNVGNSMIGNLFLRLDHVHRSHFACAVRKAVVVYWLTTERKAFSNSSSACRTLHILAPTTTVME